MSHYREKGLLYIYVHFQNLTFQKNLHFFQMNWVLSQQSGSRLCYIDSRNSNGWPKTYFYTHCNNESADSSKK